MFRSGQTLLKKWYENKNRKPLVLRGARQVGKSTLVRLFCAERKLDLIEVNLELTPLKSLEIDDPNPLALILDEILMNTHKRISENSLIFLDEIQQQPKLVTMLRYFYEFFPQIPIISAGSLLEIALKQGDFSFPVGRVEFMHIGPMTFQEFLLALKEDELENSLSLFKINSLVHERALGLFEKYLYVGGMPEAVLRFAESKSLNEIASIHKQLLFSYRQDFPKYKKRINIERLGRVFQNVGINAGRKVIYQNFDLQSRSSEIKTLLQLLIDAHLLIPVFHSKGVAPLQYAIEDNIFKLYFVDVGLLGALQGVDYFPSETGEILANKGILAEQFVAQHLFYSFYTAIDPHLEFWLNDKGSNKAEIDFLLSYHGKIIPIEIKAGEGGKLKSLFYFANEKNTTYALKLSTQELKINNASHTINHQLVSLRYDNLPLYLIDWIKEYLHREANKLTA